MRKNGFTLIELLAVIVILAIIALIATPIILGIINDAREESNERSVELYASAVRNAIAAYQLTGTSAPTKFSDLDIQYDGNVVCFSQTLYEDGSFYLEGCRVNDSEKEYSYGIKKSMCTLEDKNGDGDATLSDIVTCGTESFYVMFNENNEITMLSMYNLYVGNIVNANPWKVTPLENPTNKQDPLAIGDVDGESTSYGTVAFSYDYHWLDEDWNLLPQYGESYPVVAYDENSELYQYVNEYERILKEDLKVSSARASLIGKEELERLNCSMEDNSCSNPPEWLYSTAYWGNFAYDTYNVMCITPLMGVDIMFDDAGFDSYYGVRPVITISTTEIG